MNKKDNGDEGPGLIAILIIIVLAAVGLYYFFSHRPPTALNIDDNPNAPLEAPASLDNDGGNEE
ncbi:hypothetical protein BN59_00549 [Legionella massiliensis]|uniref:Uncharacterized protein n=1 Tax=Legionella massiliensis TaxID=1034943 RepID=A0A078KTJ2_9GAMM|nr:hypothetical protein [Legionella massiliensis]CDZ76282.1 hypothetical protein BN59_00549 [Legionella massiliensis]CEE12020.1 hypothetical protein BN1094_00549 [Legionella massiliensis]